MTTPDLIGFLRASYADEAWPKPFHILEGLQKIDAGLAVKDAAKAVGTHAKRLEAARNSGDPEFDILGVRPAEITEHDLKEAERSSADCCSAALPRWRLRISTDPLSDRMPISN